MHATVLIGFRAGCVFTLNWPNRRWRISQSSKNSFDWDVNRLRTLKAAFSTLIQRRSCRKPSPIFLKYFWSQLWKWVLPGCYRYFHQTVKCRGFCTFIRLFCWVTYLFFFYFSYLIFFSLFEIFFLWTKPPLTRPFHVMGGQEKKTVPSALCST